MAGVSTKKHVPLIDLTVEDTPKKKDVPLIDLSLASTPKRCPKRRLEDAFLRCLVEDSSPEECKYYNFLKWCIYCEE